MITPIPNTRQMRRATARQKPQSPEPHNRRLTEQIIAHGQTVAAQAQAAARVTHAHLTEGELHAWRQDLEARLQVIHQHPEQNLGHIEEEMARATKETLRLMAQRAAQAKAKATACHCQHCQRELIHQKYLARTIESRFGPLRLWRRYGWCPRKARGQPSK